MKNRGSALLWGLAFIFAGIGFAGNAFGIWNFEPFFNGWWTLFIIVPCLISLFREGFHVSTLTGLAIGVILLLSAQGILDRVLMSKLFLPVLLVLIGLHILFRNSWHSAAKRTQSSGDSGSFCDCCAVLGGREELFTGWLGGANLTAVLGNAALDLRNAAIDHDIVISATVFLGGAELQVPANVRVHVNATPILGGIENRVNEPVGENPPTVYLNALCVMGGVHVK